MKVHIVCVKVAFDFNIGSKAAKEKVRRWLEHNGHTTSSFGFEFLDIVKPTFSLGDTND
jgi:hypothetical protein